MSTTDRRTQIVDAAIDLIAAQGLRALTHRAIDSALALPAGSVSYYFRTKRTLIAAIADRITSRSRADFIAAGLSMRPLDQTDSTSAEPVTGAEVAASIAAWLDRLLVERRSDLIVRHALIIELLADAELHQRLAHSLFSTERARDLFEALGFPEPGTAGADFIAVIEGAVFDRFAGARADMPAGTPQSVRQLAALLSPHLDPPEQG